MHRQTERHRQTDTHTERQTHRHRQTERAIDTYTDVNKAKNASVSEDMQSVACVWVDNQQSMNLAVRQVKYGIK